MSEGGHSTVGPPSRRQSHDLATRQPESADSASGELLMDQSVADGQNAINGKKDLLKFFTFFIRDDFWLRGSPHPSQSMLLT